MLQWYLSDRTYSNTKADKHIVYFDNLVVATSYIGPTADNANSKAPPAPRSAHRVQALNQNAYQ